MKTKHYAVATEKMKSALLYPYGPLTGTGCCRMLHAKHIAMTSAVYTLNISILIVLLYAWRISVNVKRYGDLEDVYYGVQIAYFAIIGTQMSMIVLSIMLMFGIYRENPGLVVPWIIGFITFMALEAVAMVYSNVLRDHVNKQFDAMCKAEVAFFIARAFINTTNTSSRGGGCGGTGSDSECFLNENFDDDDDSFDYTMSDIEDCDTDLANLEDHSPMNRSRKYRVRSQLEVIDELEKSANSGSEEDDSLLVAYDSNSVGSV
ncbi:unnamed protein product [Hermetia illucens]|uniref:Uncharacterized protein n=1 Tax=Hermetia illucens TaxID=343691 RepID=A0A7R8YP67_HERIL|nr:unnamed protein product [Hermetia illucens]